MHLPASSTVDIVMNPKPRERSDCAGCTVSWHKDTENKTIAHPLIIHDNDLLDMAETAELVVEVALYCTNAQAEYAQHVGWIRRLLRNVSSRKFFNYIGDQQLELVKVWLQVKTYEKLPLRGCETESAPWEEGVRPSPLIQKRGLRVAGARCRPQCRGRRGSERFLRTT